MSTTIDSRVVEMRFDNKQFEQNVSTTMSTLDKLKAKLKLKDASEGLDNLGKSAKKVDMSNFKDASKSLDKLGKSAKNVDMSHLSNGIETVKAKFSAMQVVGVTALANITNSAVNAGKRIVSALTIDPIKSGFQEYETQMNAVQTILANTQKEGTNVEIVNKALDELNTYADKTIYNFTEMTRNIGTFTAAGVDLKTSVNAIQGIANLAAVSGSTSQQASTAMYQLSQALSSGTVKLMDWNSVVNAGMGGQVFQDALKETSRLLGTGADAAIKAEGSFRESLKTGWLTSEVLTETLKKFTTSGANEKIAEYTGLSKESVEAALKEAEARYGEAEAIEYASKALAEKSGKNQEEIKATLNMAKTAEDAATKVKTFTQLWDTLKEAAQSGWGQTWRLLIGDFEKAKERMTKLSDTLGAVIGKSADNRNNALSGALNSKWDKLIEKVNAAGIETETFQNKITELAKSHGVDLDAMIAKEGSFSKALQKAFSSKQLDKSIIKDALKGLSKNIDEATRSTGEAADQMEKFGDIVNKVVSGDFGNGEVRIKKLAEAGYDYATIQNLVNKKLGSSIRHMESLTEEQIKNADSLADLSDEQLKSKGYTEEQVIALRDLQKAAEDSDSSINDLIDSLDRPSGSEMLWDSIFNIMDSIVESCKAIKQAWTEVFHPGMTEDQIIEDRANKLYNLISVIYDFTQKLEISGETANKITRTFKGLFALLKLVGTFVGGPLSVAFKLIARLLGAFNVPLLDITASVGDAIVGFEEWLTSILDLSGGFEALVGVIKEILSPFKEVKEVFEELFLNSDNIDEGTSKVKGALGELKEAFNLNGNAAENFKNIIDGLVSIMKGFSYTISKSLTTSLKILRALLDLFGLSIGDVVASILNGIVAIKKWADEHIFLANSVDEVAKILKALIEGVKECISAFLELEPVKNVIEAIKNAFTSLFGNLKDGFGNVNIGSFVEKIRSLFSNLANWIRSLSNSENIGRDILLGLANGLKSGISFIIGIAMNVGKAIIDAVKSILGIHSPSTVFMEIGRNVMEGFVNGLQNGASTVWGWMKSFASKVVEIIKSIDFGKIFTVALAAGVVALSVNLLKLANRFADVAEAFAAPFKGLGKALTGIGNWFNSLAKLADAKVWKIKSQAILNMAIAIGILAASVYVLSKIDSGSLWKAVGALAAIATILGLLSLAISKISFSGDTSFAKLGLAFASLGVSLFLVATAMKKLEFLNWNNVGPILSGLTAMVLGMGILMAAAGNSPNADKAGINILKMATALTLMAFTMKIIAGMSAGDIAKGIITITLLSGIITGLIAATKLLGTADGVGNIGSTIFKMAAALILMIGIIKLISGMEVGELAKGLVCITLIGGIIAGLIKAMSLAGGSNVKGIGSTLLAMSAAMMLMTLTVKMLAGMEVGELVKGIACITIFGLILTGLAKVLQSAALLEANGMKQSLKGVGSTLLAMALAIGIIAGVAVILGLVDLAALAKGVTAVAILGSIMALMVHATKNAKDCKGNLIAMSVAIGVMAAAVVALSFIEPGKLVGAVAAIGSLMAIFALMVKATQYAQKAMGTIAILTAVVGVLAGVIYLLSGIPFESAIGASASLSMLILSIAGTLKIMNTLTGDLMGALRSVVALSAMVVPLALFAAVLGAISGVQNAVTNALALVILVGAMAGLLIALSAVGLAAEATGGSALIGILLLTTMAVPLFALVEVLRSMNGIENAVQNATVLAAFAAAMTLLLLPLTLVGALGPAALVGVLLLWSLALPLNSFIDILSAMSGVQNAEANANLLMNLMTTLSDVLVKVSLLGPLALIGVTAITALSGLMIAIGGLATGIGALVTKFPVLEQFIDKGLVIFEKLAYGIGSIISNFAQGMVSGLPKIGTKLSEFMDNANSFIEGAKKVDGSAITGIKTLVASIMALSEANFIDTISSLFSKGDSFARLGTNLSDFMNNSAGFIEGASKFDEDSINGVKAMMDMLKALTGDGIFDSLGKTFDALNIGMFSLQIKAFAEVMSSVSESLSGIDLRAIKDAAKAGEAMAEFADSIPTDFGNDNMTDFGSQLTPVAESMRSLSNELTKEGGIDTGAIKNAAKAGKAMTDFAESIPTDWGKFWLGDSYSTFNQFSNSILPMIKGLRDVSDELTKDGGINAGAIKNAAKAGEAMAEFADSIPTDFGDNNMTGFGSQLKTVGEGIKDFCDKINEADINTGKVSSAVEAGKSLADLADVVPRFDIGNNNLSNFSSQFKQVGKSIGDFCNEIDGANINIAKTESAINVGNMLAEFSKTAEFDGKKDFSKMGEQVGHIVGALKEMNKAFDGSEGSVTLNTEAMSQVIQSAKDIGAMLNDIPPMKGDGAKNFDGMDLQVSHITAALKEINKAFDPGSEGSTSLNTEVIAQVIQSAKDIAGMMNDIPPMKGDGAKNFEGMDTQVSHITAALKEINKAFDPSSEGNAPLNTEVIAQAIQSAKDVAGMLNEMPDMKADNSKDFSGMDLQVSHITAAIMELSKHFDGSEGSINLNTELIGSAVQSAKDIAGMLNEMPTINGEGSKDFQGMDTQIGYITTALKNMSTELSGITIDTGKISSAKTACDDLKVIMEKLEEVSKKDISNASNNITSAKTAITDFSTACANNTINTEKMKEAVTAIQDFSNSVGNIDFSGFDKLNTAISNISTSGIDALVTKFQNAGSQLSSAITSMVNNAVSTANNSASSFKAPGQEFVNNIVSGINEKKGDIKSAVETAATEGVNALRGKYQDFYNAGSYVVEGAAAGVSNNAYKLSDAINSMAEAAKKTFTVNVEIKSPSRVFAGYGKYIVEGLANGITDNIGSSNKAVENMANSLLDTTQDTLGIHSPSLVFKEEVGRYIVQGIAEGIREETDAEKAAAEKAQKIANVIKDVFSEAIRDVTHDVDVNDLNLDIWKLKDGRNAPESTVMQKELETAKKNYPSLKTAAILARDYYLDLKGHKSELGEDADKLIDDAYTEMMNRYKTFYECQSTIKDLSEVTNDDIRDYNKSLIDAAESWTDTEITNEERHNIVSNAYKNIAENLESEYLAAKKVVDELEANGKKETKEWYTAQKAMLEALTASNEGWKTYHDIQNSFIDEKVDSNDNKIRVLQSDIDYRNSLDSNEISDTFRNNQNMRDLHNILKLAKENLVEIEAQWADICKKGLENTEEGIQIRQKLIEALKAKEDADDAIWDQIISVSDKNKERCEDAISRSQTELDLWEELYGDKATDEERDAKYLKYYNEAWSQKTAIARQSQKDYIKAVEEYGKGSQEAKKYWDIWQEALVEEARAKNDVTDYIKEAQERENEQLKELYDLTQSNADLNYQIWEKTLGRDATNAEKNARKLAILTQQREAQSQSVILAMRLYNETISEYGEGSNEALSAYNDYLKESLELANLNSEILDIEEENAKRREKARNAKSDYLEYMKKYEKYYLDHDMTLEELEKDARLVTGYNPDYKEPATKTVQSIVEETNKAIKDLVSSSDYDNLVTNFGSIGTSFADAVNTGVDSESIKVVSTTTNMVKNCLTAVTDQFPSWTTAGSDSMSYFATGLESMNQTVENSLTFMITGWVSRIYSTKGWWVQSGCDMVLGFVSGMESQINKAAEMAARMAYAALSAANAALGIHSPSREFAKVGAYAAMGLAEGFSNNSDIAANAAMMMADATIDSLRNTIAAISEVINSDVDCEPTIRPLLDLSSVEEGASKLNAMFSKKQAINISNDMNRQAVEGSQNGDNTNGENTTYQFTQNNYSPKALSRAEIYRQTKNQFSAMKRTVKV